MPTFTVTTVVDGDTFDVSPSWKWDNETGDRIRPAGYDAPEFPSYAGQAAKDKLVRLVGGKQVDVGNAYKIDRGRLVCDVFLNGRNLADYFPEYK